VNRATYQKLFLLLSPNMDPLMLITLCSALKGCYEWEALDKLFSSFFPLDPDGMTWKAFDVILRGSNRILHLCDLIYFFACCHGSDTEDDLMELAAMAHGSCSAVIEILW
jgi:hypothetical protein